MIDLSTPLPVPPSTAAKLLFRCLFSGAPQPSVIELRCRSAAAWQPEFLREPDQAADRAVDLSADREVYFGVLPRGYESGKGTAVVCGRAMWADCDTPESVTALTSFNPAPPIVVRTSPGHFHAYWILRHWTAPDRIEQGCQRLAYRLGSDPVVFDRPRILRPAGTVNRKRDREPVELVRFDTGEAQDWNEVVGDLPDKPVELDCRKPTDHRRKTVDPDSDITRLAEALEAIPADVYIPLLTGREPDRGGKIQCPFHEDWIPSFHVYPGDRGWACFQCPPPAGKRHLGGNVFTFGSHLWNMHNDSAFPALVKRLANELLSGGCSA